MSFPSVFRIKKKKTAELQVPYKVVFLSDAQQSESVTHTRPLCCRSPSRPGHPGAPGRAAWLRGGSSSLAYFAQRTAVSMRQCQTPDSSHPLLPHGNQKFVPYVRDYFCFAGKFTCTNSLGSTYKQHCMVFVWHTSLCITICRSIHVTANGIISSFLRLSNTHCICIPLLDPFLSQ